MQGKTSSVAKLLAIIIGVVALVICGTVFMMNRSSDGNIKVSNHASPQTTTSPTYDAVDACDILTEAVASQVLGAAPAKGDTGINSISSAHLNASTCSYSYANSSETHTTRLLVQSAK